MTNPAVPLGVILVIVVGMLAGQMTYKWKQDIILTSVVTVVLAFVGIWLGTLALVKNFFTVCAVGTTVRWASDSPMLFVAVTQAQFVWSLLAWSSATSAPCCRSGAGRSRSTMSPSGSSSWASWPARRPADLAPGLRQISRPSPTGAVTCAPPRTAPQLIQTVAQSARLGPLWPILFVTIACGAVSGWHSLVSSSGTARQLEKETDALYVGGGAMFLEMFLATLSLLTAVVGVGVTKGFAGYVGMIAAGQERRSVCRCLSEMMAKIGVPTSFGLPYGSVFLTLMGLTIMYLVVRFMRVAIGRILGESVPLFKNTTSAPSSPCCSQLVLIYAGFCARSGWSSAAPTS